MSDAPPGDDSSPDVHDAGEREWPVAELAEGVPVDSQEDFIHESIELPEWISIAFGLLLVTIGAAAIYMA